jgi:hypothetical protein
MEGQPKGRRINYSFTQIHPLLIRNGFLPQVGRLPEKIRKNRKSTLAGWLKEQPVVYVSVAGKCFVVTAVASGRFQKA